MPAIVGSEWCSNIAVLLQCKRLICPILSVDVTHELCCVDVVHRTTVITTVIILAIGFCHVLKGFLARCHIRRYLINLLSRFGIAVFIFVQHPYQDMIHFDVATIRPFIRNQQNMIPKFCFEHGRNSTYCSIIRLIFKLIHHLQGRHITQITTTAFGASVF